MKMRAIKYISIENASNDLKMFIDQGLRYGKVNNMTCEQLIKYLIERAQEYYILYP
jgi:hypothetical protein